MYLRPLPKKEDGSYTIAKDSFFNIQLEATLPELTSYQAGLTLTYAGKTDTYLIKITRTAAPEGSLQFEDATKIELNCVRWFILPTDRTCEDTESLALQETTGKESVTITKPEVILKITGATINAGHFQFFTIGSDGLTSQPFGSEGLTIQAGTTSSTTLSITDPRLRSGKYTGQIRIEKGDGNFITRDIEVNVKHGWILPAFVLILGIFASIMLFQYQDKRLPEDKVWLQKGQLTRRVQELPTSPEKDKIVRLIEQAEDYLSLGRITEAQGKIDGAVRAIVVFIKDSGENFLDSSVTEGRELLGTGNEIPKARWRVTVFQIITVVVTVVLLFVSVFQELYINNPSFGSFTNYAQLFFSGFVADITRQSVINLGKKFNLPFPS
jgi:hypothetical protein